MIIALSGCSFVDEVHVNLGDGVRLISINEQEPVIHRDDTAAEGTVSGAAISESKSGPSSGPGAQATGFKCSLEQSGTRSSLLSSLFSPPEKTAFASLTCWRLFEQPQNSSNQTN